MAEESIPLSSREQRKKPWQEPELSRSPLGGELVNIHFRKDNSSGWEVQINISSSVLLTIIGLVFGLPVIQTVNLILQRGP